MDYLAVFRQRSDALKVLNALRERKIACAAVNTPSYLKAGCGISVVFPYYLKDKVQDTIRSVGATSFGGFYNR